MDENLMRDIDKIGKIVINVLFPSKLHNRINYYVYNNLVHNTWIIELIMDVRIELALL